MRKLYLATILIFSYYPFYAQQTVPPMQTLENILLKEVKNKHTPSVQYLIFNKDSILYRKEIGLRTIKNNHKTDTSTSYAIFSITKTFTALAILQLAEKGKLDINTSAKEYLASFPYSHTITIKQLLSHSAGIPNPIPLHWIHTKDKHQQFNSHQFFDAIFKKHAKIKAPPNKKFKYSNLGYVLLGQIIENVSKMSYQDYIETHIIKKLHLKNDELGFSSSSTHATGYQKKWSLTNFLLGFLLDKKTYMERDTKGWKPFKEYYVNGKAYGGLSATASSLMIYIQELLKPNSNLISEKYKTLLFTENFTSDNKPTSMCLSWFKGTLHHKPYVTHAGGGGGFYSEIRIYPTLEMGSVLLFNRTGIKDERFLDKLDTFFIK